MNGAQLEAFERSTGGVSPATLSLAIASTAALIALIWLAWLSYAQFRVWQTSGNKESFYDMKVNIIRAAVMVLLLGFFIR